MHYAIIVRLEHPDEVESEEDLKEALNDVLEPYSEEPVHERFLEWHDREAEWLAEYQAGVGYWIRQPDGELHIAIEQTPGAVAIANRDRYPTFEQFVAEGHCVEERDRWYRRFGEWNNPNGRWDWWSIGGRWPGFLVDREGNELNYARYAQLDVQAMEREADRRAREHYDNVHKLMRGELAPELRQELRMRGLDRGLMRLDKPGSTARPGELVAPPLPPRLLASSASPIEMDVEIYWVGKNEDDYLGLARKLLHPLQPAALLDERGWLEHSYGTWDLDGIERQQLEVAQHTEMLDRLFHNPRPEHMLVLVDIHR